MAETVYSDAITEAQRELETLKKRHADLLDKIKALELFIRSGSALVGRAVPLSSVAEGVPGAPPLTNGIPIADQVAHILKEAGKPLHIKEIIRRLRAVRNLTGKNVTANVIVSLKRRGNQFRKTAPNTFALGDQK
jgi:hypothetical protein